MELADFFGKIAHYDDDFPREKLAEILRKPINEIEPDALRLASAILDGSIPFKSSPKPKNKKNMMNRDSVIHHLMSLYTGMGLPAFYEGADLDAAVMTENDLKKSLSNCCGHRPAGRKKINEIFSKQGANKGDGKRLILKSLSLNYLDIGKSVLKFNGDKVPETIEEAHKMIVLWCENEVKSGRESFFNIEK